MKSRGFRSILLARVADLISLVHVGVVVIAAFGWWLTPNSFIHFGILLATLISWLATGSCILAQLEYRVRKQYLATIEPYNAGYLHYHLRKFTGYAPSLTFIRRWGYVYLTSALVLWIADYIVRMGMLA